MSKKLYEIISNVMQIPISKLNDNSGPENMENWDSFHGLLLVDELESNFEITFELEDIVDIKSIADIKTQLKKYGVNLD